MGAFGASLAGLVLALAVRTGAAQDESRCWTCPGRPGECFPNCWSCTTQYTENGRAFTINSTIHCPLKDSNMGRCVHRCSDDCPARPAACSNLCVGSCLDSCLEPGWYNGSTFNQRVVLPGSRSDRMVTSAGDWNGGGSRLWECPATGVCIENCTGAELCEGYPYPSAENGNNYTIEYWYAKANNEFSNDTDGSVAGFGNLFRQLTRVPTYEVNRLFQMDGKCKSFAGYRKAETARCVAATTSFQQMMMQAQGTMGFLHLFAMFYFLEYVKSTRRPYEILIKQKIRDSAVAVSALIGAMIASSRVSFMLAQKSVCPTPSGAMFSTPFSAWEAACFTAPGFLGPHLAAMAYVALTTVVKFLKGPETANKGVQQVSKLFAGKLWSDNDGSGFQVVCGDNATTIGARKACIAKRSYKWQNLFFQIKREGLVSEDIIAKAVATYIGYFDVVWATLFSTCYIMFILSAAFALAFTTSALNMWQPAAMFKFGLFGTTGGSFSSYQLGGIWSFVAFFIFSGVMFYAYRRVMSLDDWYYKICDERCHELHDFDVRTGYHSRRAGCGRAGANYLNAAMFDRCDEWYGCMSCDGLDEEMLQYCGLDFNIETFRQSGQEHTPLYTKKKSQRTWGKAERAWLDRMAVCWTLAMDGQKIPDTVPLYN